jgi:hypothetical protein
MQELVVVTYQTRVTTLSHADSRNLDCLTIDLDAVHFVDSSLCVLYVCVLNKSETLAPTCQWIAMNVDVIDMTERLKQFLQSVLLNVGETVNQTSDDDLHRSTEGLLSRFERITRARNTHLSKHK